MSIRAFITGCAGSELTGEERDFFEEVNPFGLILFARNCQTPDQIKNLTASFRQITGRDDAPVLIDQEGGRVQRLSPPEWRSYPAAADIGALYRKNPEKGLEAARLLGHLLAGDLIQLGINVDCVPVLDVPAANAHGIIGDRAFSSDPGAVGQLGKAQVLGLQQGGCLPVIKHIPGHGRAECDSHEALPVTDAPLDDLKACDFAPFKALDDCIFAMTAHVVYKAIDPDSPATTSRSVIQDVIRGEIGFSGLLMTDDLSMKALKGPMAGRTEAAFRAGCDIALHCNGDMAEMRAVAGASPELGESALAMYSQSLGKCGNQNCGAGAFDSLTDFLIGI